MCYYVSITVDAQHLRKAFGATAVNPKLFTPIYSVSGFSFPDLPIITNNNPQAIDLLQWGLIPFWVKDRESANEIRSQTLNARAERRFEKPSFRHAIKSKRCMVLVDGFFEWRHEKSKAYPYYIRLKNHEPFAIAGIWDGWNNPETKEQVRTFSVITTEANTLLAKIHNTKKRMPVILPKNMETQWLQNDPDAVSIKTMLKPYNSDDMDAYTVSNMVNRLGFNTGNPKVLERKEYHDLSG